MVLQRVGIEGMAAFGFYDSVRHSKLKLVHSEPKLQKTILSSEDIKSSSRSRKVRRHKSGCIPVSKKATVQSKNYIGQW